MITEEIIRRSVEFHGNQNYKCRVTRRITVSHFYKLGKIIKYCKKLRVCVLTQSKEEGYIKI